MAQLARALALRLWIQFSGLFQDKHYFGKACGKKNNTCSDLLTFLWVFTVNVNSEVMCANILIDMQGSSCRLLPIDSIIDFYSSLSCLSVCSSLCPPVCLSASLSVFPFVCISVCLTDCLSVCLFIYIYISLPFRLNLSTDVKRHASRCYKIYEGLWWNHERKIVWDLSPWIMYMKQCQIFSQHWDGAGNLSPSSRKTRTG